MQTYSSLMNTACDNHPPTDRCSGTHKCQLLTPIRNTMIPYVACSADNRAGICQRQQAAAYVWASPVIRLGVLGESQIGVVEGFNCSNVLPVPVIQVGLHVHAQILGTRNHFTAKIVCLHGPCTAETCVLAKMEAVGGVSGVVFSAGRACLQLLAEYARPCEGLAA